MDASTTPDDGRIDGRRARELYRYFQPSNPAALNEGCEPYVDELAAAAAAMLLDSVNRPSSPNSTLTSLAQLAALRLNAQRALIRSLNLGDPTKYEAPGDGLWAGCSAVSRAGSLCENTLELPPSERGQYSFFIVNDLAKDDAFQKLPFGANQPPFGFYAGTPLTTESKVNIGTFFVLDVKPRDGLTESEKSTMGTLATLVMDYLRVSRQASEGRRAARLSRGLSFFVEGSSSFIDGAPSGTKSSTPLTSSTLHPGERRSSHTISSRGRGSSVEAWSSRSRSGEGERSSSVSEGKDTATSSDVTTPLPEWLGMKGEKGQAAEVHDNLWAFQRAANLLRESLELGTEGGVIFLESSTSPWLDADHGREDDFSQSTSPAPVLAVSTHDEPFAPEPGSAASSPAANFNRRFLQQMLKRYPNGKLWSFHRDRTLFSSDEDEKSHTGSPGSAETPDRSKSGKKWKATESAVLNAYFPTASQVLFVPLWNAASSQWFAGCFCWNSVETRVFSGAVELSSVMGFASSIMAECSRVESLIADRQKGDFIGSISHELRSPLHGILAAAEFLDGTPLNEFQKSLLDTVNSCGRTLLDTMNQVLDFSKIVSLERSWRLMRRRKDTPREIKSSENISAHLDTYVSTDIAVLAEEVIEGVCLGYSYGRVGGSATADLRGDLIHSTGSRPVPQRREISDPLFGLEVVIDIRRGDWIFKTQPGALRRIVMNIFGNAIKYTEKGRITVRLESAFLSEDATHQQTPGDLAVLTVSDTGKGISEEFLRGRLYTPFAQEDTLAVGTGLGLSIVRSIVKTLGGSISIRSRPGEGTVVKVSLPLGRPGADDNTPETPRMQRSPNETSVQLRLLQEGYPRRKVAILGFNSESHAESDPLSVIARYITDWFGLKLVSWPPHTPVDVLLADEHNLTVDLKRDIPGYLPAILILCNNSTNRTKATIDWSTLAAFVDFVHRPCGPHKLAKSILRCLKGSQAMAPFPDTFEDQSPTLLGNADNNIVSGGVELNTAPLSIEPEPVPDPAAAGLPGKESEMSVVMDASRDSIPSLAVREGRLTRKSAPVIPFFSENPPVAVPAPPLPLENGTPQRSRASRILVVDDNRINLRLMLTFMKKRGFAVLDSAENGKMAVDAVERMQEGYNIIFMDISMPVMNGFEATRAIRALEKERDGCGPATIIALTGLTSARDETEALSSGVDLFLTKPVSFKEVSRLLDEWEQKPHDQ